MRYGMSAARFPCEPKAAAMRSMPAALWAASARTEHLGEVLVAAARERHEVELRAARVGEQPGQRVGGLEGGDDPLEARDAPERLERLAVGHGLVPDAPLVSKEGVLRAGAG